MTKLGHLPDFVVPELDALPLNSSSTSHQTLGINSTVCDSCIQLNASISNPWITHKEDQCTNNVEKFAQTKGNRAANRRIRSKERRMHAAARQFAAEQRCFKTSSMTNSTVTSQATCSQSEQKSSTSLRGSNEVTYEQTLDKAERIFTPTNRWKRARGTDVSAQLAGISGSIDNNDAESRFNVQHILNSSDTTSARRAALKHHLYKSRKKHETDIATHNHKNKVDVEPKSQKSEERTELSGLSQKNSRNGDLDQLPVLGPYDDVCRYHLIGCCSKGDSCPFIHNFKKHPCRFYHAGAIANPSIYASGGGYCQAGDKCKFSHDSLDIVSRAKLVREVNRLSNVAVPAENVEPHTQESEPTEKKLQEWNDFTPFS